ncbi:hypothetical protein DL762_002582 [Monosporascus cannonballus]|uniref:Xylanolytic transcriptional activator regulatory domain-containing protein n=1 Tax=Monosporascus cannonballus TaxID=155416 RepID=A0ABY0HH75_9PEZI|nr:hypothetical protein DL762_002582 [Monosporascus cannonballus]
MEAIDSSKSTPDEADGHLSHSSQPRENRPGKSATRQLPARNTRQIQQSISQETPPLGGKAPDAKHVMTWQAQLPEVPGRNSTVESLKPNTRNQTAPCELADSDNLGYRPRMANSPLHGAASPEPLAAKCTTYGFSAEHILQLTGSIGALLNGGNSMTLPELYLGFIRDYVTQRIGQARLAANHGNLQTMVRNQTTNVDIISSSNESDSSTADSSHEDSDSGAHEAAVLQHWGIMSKEDGKRKATKMERVEKQQAAMGVEVTAAREHGRDEGEWAKQATVNIEGLGRQRWPRAIGIRRGSASPEVTVDCVPAAPRLIVPAPLGLLPRGLLLVRAWVVGRCLGVEVWSRWHRLWGNLVMTPPLVGLIKSISLSTDQDNHDHSHHVQGLASDENVEPRIRIAPPLVEDSSSLHSSYHYLRVSARATPTSPGMNICIDPGTGKNFFGRHALQGMEHTIEKREGQIKGNTKGKDRVNEWATVTFWIVAFREPTGRLSSGHSNSYFNMGVQNSGLLIQTASRRSIVYLSLASLYCLFSPQAPGPWMMVGLAMKHCIPVGLHRKAASRGADLSSELDQHLFWTVYRLDRHTAISTGRPNSLADCDIDVPLPLDIDESAVAVEDFRGATRKALQLFNTPQYTTLSYFIHTIKLYRLRSSIQRKVYRVDKDEPLPQKMIDQLLADLDKWQRTQPPNCDTKCQGLNIIDYNLTVRLILFPQFEVMPFNEHYISILAQGCA